jgi:Flp pilus assembly pilin Flp|tara:strand:- start:554 stop:763 length:210 start_codon:yes stop_codon:yes gene_type:complete
MIVTLRRAIMGNFLSRLHKDEDGQGMTEYVIILVAIAVVCIAITVTFGGKIKVLFETADAEIDTVDSGL